MPSSLKEKSACLVLPSLHSLSLPCSLPHHKWWESLINSLCRETLSVSQATPLTRWLKWISRVWTHISVECSLPSLWHLAFLLSSMGTVRKIETFPPAWVLEGEDALSPQKSSRITANLSLHLMSEGNKCLVFILLRIGLLLLLKLTNT